MSTLSRILLLSVLSVFMSGCFLKDLIFPTGPKCEDAEASLVSRAYARSRAYPEAFPDWVRSNAPALTDESLIECLTTAAEEMIDAGLDMPSAADSRDRLTGMAVDIGATSVDPSIVDRLGQGDNGAADLIQLGHDLEEMAGFLPALAAGDPTEYQGSNSYTLTRVLWSYMDQLVRAQVISPSERDMLRQLMHDLSVWYVGLLMDQVD